MKIKNDGYSMVWVLIALAAFSLGIYAMTTPAAPVSYFIYGAVGILLAWGLWFEAKHDLYVFAQITFLAAFCVGIISGLILYTEQEVQNGPLIAAILAAIGFIFSVFILARTELASDDLPNIFDEFIDWSNVSEIDGIQFVASQFGNILQTTEEAVLIEIIVQNTWNTEREISFGLKTERRVSLNLKGLIHDSSPSILLGPAEVGKLSIGVAAHPDAKGLYSLVLHPKVKGRGGKRVRIKRATIYSAPSGVLMVFAALIAGVVVYGGGTAFSIRVKHLASNSMVPRNPPEVEKEIIWTLDDYTGPPIG